MTSAEIPFLDLKAQYRSIAAEIEDAALKVLRSAQYVLGPEVAEFEAKFAEAHDIEHCIGSNNGTSALHLALWALGIERGDQVILPVNTFIATAEAVMLCGADPVLVDHDEFYNIDLAACEAAINSKTRAIIAVHLYGQPASMIELRKLADRHKLVLIEDAAQAHLAKFDGRSIGSFSDATCFSFYPGKNLGAYGEAGAVITKNAELAQVMHELRDHGSQQKYHHPRWGHNYRMEALQGAILRVKLSHLAAWTTARQANAALYAKHLAGIDEIELPKVHPLATPVWHLYVIQADDRDKLKEYLTEHGVGTGLHYPIPLDRQGAFAGSEGATGSYPRSDRTVGRILSLPMFAELSEAQINRVSELIRSFYSSSR